MADAVPSLRKGRTDGSRCRRGRPKQGSRYYLAVLPVAHVVARQHAHDRPDLQPESVPERCESRLACPDSFRTGNLFTSWAQPVVRRPDRCSNRTNEQGFHPDRYRTIEIPAVEGRQRPDRLQPPERGAAHRAGTILRPRLGITKRGNLFQLQSAEE